MEKNIFITGIPRSGTSLLTFLFSKDSNNICMSEPDFMKKVKRISKNKSEVVANLNNEILNIRNQIASGNKITMRVTKDNLIPDNYFHRKEHSVEKLRTTSEFRKVLFNCKDSKNNLIIKNNLLFTSCLECLVGLGDVLAIIRHPLPVLLSWQSLNIPVSKGNAHTGQKYSKSLNQLPQKSDLLLRQIKIIDWFYLKYKRNNVNLIKYEDLVLDPHKTLKVWMKNTQLPSLSSKNQTNRYTTESTELIEKYLENHSELYNEIYKK